MIILSNLGLGDHILCNGIVRWWQVRTKEEPMMNRLPLPEIIIPCYAHNKPSVSFMYSDLPNIRVMGFSDEAAILDYCSLAKGMREHVVRLGHYCKHKKFDPEHYDQSFYEQAGVPFEDRWSGFKLPSQESGLPQDHAKEGWRIIFGHDDAARGYNIDPYRMNLHSQDRVIRPRPDRGHIFWWRDWINAADEIHVINSAFLCLIDSLPKPPGQARFVHQYARQGALPTLSEGWKVLQ